MSLQVLVKQQGEAGGLSLPPTLSVLDVVISPGMALAELRFIEDGTIEDQNSMVIGNWYTPTTPGIGNSYEIRWTNGTGTLDSATPMAGTWGSISPSAAFNKGRATVGVNTVTGTVDIREIANPSNADSSAATIEAEVSL